jgi:hypothetical protein
LHAFMSKEIVDAELEVVPRMTMGAGPEPRFLCATTLSVSASALLAWMAISCVSAPARGEPSLPPVRPHQTSQPGATKPAPPPSAATPSPAPLGESAACLAQLNASHVEAQAVPAPPAQLGDCVIAAPVRVTSIALANGATLDLPDRPILDCAFGVTFSEFVRDLMAPLAAAMLGSPIVALGTGPGYECRGRNQVAGAKTSAHGKGIAIDLAEIRLNDGRRIEVAHQANAAEELFVATTRRAACGWFTTVLGPGSDPAHAEHFHFDVMRHGSTDNYRICE